MERRKHRLKKYEALGTDGRYASDVLEIFELRIETVS